MTNDLWVSETYLNADNHVIFGESEWYETYTDDLGDLYRDMVREFGRCTGRIYRDTETGPVAVGWVFLKRMTYEDARSSDDTYLREVWVEVSLTPVHRHVSYDHPVSPWQKGDRR